MRRGLWFIVLIRDYVRDYESTYILRDRLQYFCYWGTQMRIFLTIVLNGGFKGGQWTPRTDIGPNFAKLSAKPFFSTAFDF